jgi:hypothetical protein
MAHIELLQEEEFIQGAVERPQGRSLLVTPAQRRVSHLPWPAQVRPSEPEACRTEHLVRERQPGYFSFADRTPSLGLHRMHHESWLHSS